MTNAKFFKVYQKMKMKSILLISTIIGIELVSFISRGSVVTTEPWVIYVARFSYRAVWYSIAVHLGSYDSSGLRWLIPYYPPQLKVIGYKLGHTYIPLIGKLWSWCGFSYIIYSFHTNVPNDFRFKAWFRWTQWLLLQRILHLLTSYLLLQKHFLARDPFKTHRIFLSMKQSKLVAMLRP